MQRRGAQRSRRVALAQERQCRPSSALSRPPCYPRCLHSHMGAQANCSTEVLRPLAGEPPAAALAAPPQCQSHCRPRGMQAQAAGSPQGPACASIPPPAPARRTRAPVSACERLPAECSHRRCPIAAHRHPAAVLPGGCPPSFSARQLHLHQPAPASPPLQVQATGVPAAELGWPHE